MNHIPIEKLIANVALNFLGQREVQDNAGFVDTDFEQRMKAVGWEKGQAWCAYFAELVWKEAYNQVSENVLPVLDGLFSALAVKTWSNFKASGLFTCDQIPSTGSVVIWQQYHDGKPDWRGHAGIVFAGTANGFIAIEGNTNSAGGREGIEVSRKDRKLYFNVDNGLRLKGFIHPADPEIFK